MKTEQIARTRDRYILAHWPKGVPRDCTQIEADQDCTERMNSKPCRSCRTWERLWAEATRKVDPQAYSIEGDAWDGITDGIVNEIERRVLPYLLQNDPNVLADAVMRSVNTHLATELHYVKLGRGDVDTSFDGHIKTLRARFLRMKGK